MYTTLLTDLSNGIFTITINRPDKLNAINRDVMSELDETVAEIYANKEIRSAIITGAGPKAFVAGADISEFLGLTAQQGQALSKKGHGIFSRIEHSPKPIVAAVNGFALGGGCELALACHFRICSTNARFGQPEVNLGLIPGYGGTQRLPLLIGKAKALELMMTGAMIDAPEALRLGLVNHMVPPEELLTKTKEILSTIGEKAPIAIAKVIECVNYASGHTGGSESGTRANWVSESQTDNAGTTGGSSAGTGSSASGSMGNGLVFEQAAFGECFATDDMKEGAQAFLEKRKPHFIGK